MQCPSCGVQCLDGSTFCSECGATIAAAPAGVGAQQFSQGYTAGAPAGGYSAPAQPPYVPPYSAPQANYAPPQNYGQPQAQWQPQTPAGDFNLLEALKRPTQDTDFVKKVGICALLALVPVIGSFFVNGYGLRYLQNLIKRRDPRLPEWDNWGDLLMGGLMLFIVTLPFMLIPLVVGGIFIAPALYAAIAHNSTGGIIGSIFGGLGLMFALAVVCGIPLPMAIARYADKGDFMAAFQINVILGLIKANPGQYFTIIGALIGISFICLFVGGVIPVIGTLALLFAMPAVSLAGYSAFSDYYIRHKPD